jgi:hypothetical protein
MAIFGLYGRQQSNAAVPPGPEPVWVNGEMGVYNPDTGEFVPNTSPLFDQTCDLIQCRREQAQRYGGSYPCNGGNGVYHHWNYYPGGNRFWYSTGGASGARSWSGVSDFGHEGSVRGGIGETGHAHGGSHS